MNLDEVGRYGLIRRAVNEYITLLQFAFYSDAKSYDELRELLNDFVAGIECFGKSHQISGDRN